MIIKKFSLIIFFISFTFLFLSTNIKAQDINFKLRFDDEWKITCKEFNESLNNNKEYLKKGNVIKVIRYKYKMGKTGFGHQTGIFNDSKTLPTVVFPLPIPPVKPIIFIFYG